MSYAPKDLEDSLRRAFVDGHADYIILDSLRQEFLYDSAQYGIEQGWLEGAYKDPPPWPSQDGGTLEYRLTDKGREHFGLELKRRA